jgi:ADP-ribose pyrophosphatase
MSTGENGAAGRKGISQMFETVSSQQIFTGKILSLFLDKLRLPDGQVVEREIVRHIDAVGIAAVTKDRQIVLVRQYRPAVGKEVLEIPAGLLFSNEKPEECAWRELKEETGYQADKLKKLVSFYTSPGFSDEVLHLFLAEGLKQGKPAFEDDEYLKILQKPLEEAISLILAGQIVDAKTIIALLLVNAIYKR